MLKKTLVFAAAFIITTSTVQFGQTAAPRYLMPPTEVV